MTGWPNVWALLYIIVRMYDCRAILDLYAVYSNDRDLKLYFVNDDPRV